MKRAVVLWASGLDDFGNELYERFSCFAPKEFQEYLRNKGSRQLVFAPDAPELKQAIAFCQQTGHSFKLYNHVHYSKKELEIHPWFDMMLSDPQEVQYKSTRTYGTRYEGSCPHCKFGGRRVGTLLVNRTLLGTREIGWLGNELFVSEGLKREIESSGLTGVRFADEIRDYQGREMLKRYVMQIETVLEPMSVATWIDRTYAVSGVHGCPHGKIYLHSDIQYEKEKMERAKDFNLSCEYFNNDRKRRLIVSGKVVRLLKKHKIRNYCSPVTVLDGNPYVIIIT